MDWPEENVDNGYFHGITQYSRSLLVNMLLLTTTGNCFRPNSNKIIICCEHPLQCDYLIWVTWKNWAKNSQWRIEHERIRQNPKKHIFKIIGRFFESQSLAAGWKSTSHSLLQICHSCFVTHVPYWEDNLCSILRSITSFGLELALKQGLNTWSLVFTDANRINLSLPVSDMLPHRPPLQATASPIPRI